MDHDPGAKQAADAAMASNGKRPPLEQRSTNGPSKMTTRLVGGRNALRPAPKRMPPFVPSAPAHRRAESSDPGFTVLDHERRIAIPSSEHLKPDQRPPPTENMILTPADFDPTSRPIDECYMTRSQERARKEEQRKALAMLTGEHVYEEVPSPGSPMSLKSRLRLAKDIFTGSVAYRGTPEEFLEEALDGNIHSTDLVKRNRDSGFFKPDWPQYVEDRGTDDLKDALKNKLAVSKPSSAQRPVNPSDSSRPRTSPGPSQPGARRPCIFPQSTSIVPGLLRPARHNPPAEANPSEAQRSPPFVPSRNCIPTSREPVIRRPAPASIPTREPVIRKPLPEKPLPPSLP